MRLATFSRDGSVHVGAVLDDERVVDLTAHAPDDPAFGSMVALIASDDEALARARALVDRAASGDAPKGSLTSLAYVRLLAPIPRPSKNVFCVGLNYRSHVEANAAALGIRPDIPEVPLFFTKPPTAVIGPGESIIHDARATAKLDYEVELAIVIGRGGSWIPEAEALDHVFGYTLVNDVSARDLQWRSTQMFFGKGQDTYCPVGPWIVDRASLGTGDGSGINIGARVNGEERQADSTSELIFGVGRIVSELSKGITLEPGDLIATGTPGGCGYQMVPTRFLEPGDTVEIWAEGIGSLENSVRAFGDAR
jgi:2-keto-4-pentenoate hydratase/2-oxohepta-3-ene-1,7-dioic acid hydratase in catechol pathway